MHLVLVRHGQTSSNVHRILDTSTPGASLTDLGRAQAAALPAAFAGRPVDVLVASTHVRTQQTAAPLAADRGLEVVVRAGVREVDAGDLDLRGDDASVRTYLDTLFGWGDGHLSATIPGAESGADFLARYDAVVAELAGYEHAVVVSHSAAIRCWAAARADVDAAFVAAHRVRNTGAVELVGEPGRGWRVVAWHEDALGDVPAPPAPDEGPAAAERPAH